MINITSETHTRTAVNSSMLVHFVVSICTDHDPRAPTPESTVPLTSSAEAKSLLEEISKRISLLVAQHVDIEESRVSIMVVPEPPLRDHHFFELAAQLCILKKSTGIPYCVSLSPMGPTSKSFSGTLITDARSAMANLFGSHRGLAKIIQSMKRKNIQEGKTPDEISALLAELLQLDESITFEEDEDIVAFMQEHRSLRDVALYLSESQHH